MKVLPNNVPDLIEELEARFPPRCKKPDESLEVHAQYAGKVALVAELRKKLDAETRRQRGELPQVIK